MPPTSTAVSRKTGKIFHRKSKYTSPVKNDDNTYGTTNALNENLYWEWACFLAKVFVSAQTCDFLKLPSLVNCVSLLNKKKNKNKIIYSTLGFE